MEIRYHCEEHSLMGRRFTLLQSSELDAAAVLVELSSFCSPVFLALLFPASPQAKGEYIIIAT
jgi:hypothetical protein